MDTPPELDLSMPFRKSSYSNGGDNCVDVGLTRDGQVALHYSKHPELPPHIYARDEWTAFLVGAKHGELDL